MTSTFVSNKDHIYSDCIVVTYSLFSLPQKNGIWGIRSEIDLINNNNIIIYTNIIPNNGDDIEEKTKHLVFKLYI